MALFGGVELTGKPDLANIALLDRLPIPMIVRMERLGIAIDLPYLADLSSQLAAEMAGLQKDIAGYIPPAALDQFTTAASDIEEEQGSATINANSAEQIRALLFDLLAVGRGKENSLKRTASGLISTGKKNLELSREDHPVVSKVLEYRERSKLKSAFTDALPKRAVLHPRSQSCPVCELPHSAPMYRIHCQITTTRAETGRMQAKKPNLMQIPIRTELGGKIRQAFLAGPGKRLVSVDFAQAELRDLAHLANAQSMIDVYRQDRDIHIATACSAFKLDYHHYARLAVMKQYGGIKDPAEKADWADFSINKRLPSKNLNFMIVYGASWKGLQAQLALSKVYWDEADCRKFISVWFALYPEVQAYLDEQNYRARRYGFVWTPCGRVRLVPEVRSCHKYIREAGLRQAGNLPIQGCNAEQTKLVMGDLEDKLLAIGDAVWPILPVHDQLIAEADEDIAEDVQELMIDSFQSVMHDQQTGEDYWRVPMKADGAVLERWIKD